MLNIERRTITAAIQIKEGRDGGKSKKTIAKSRRNWKKEHTNLLVKLKKESKRARKW